MTEKKVILKPGKEKALLMRHHWLFSGAVQLLPELEPGEILPVYSSKGQFLGRAYFNPQSKILGRMLTFDEQEPKEALLQRLERALELRERFFDRSNTNGFRLVNGEGDAIAGLTVDLYDQAAVLQSSTKGMDLLKPLVVDWLKSRLKPTVIYEKSLLPSRKEEGLKEQQGVLFGSLEELVTFKENGLYFSTKLQQSQKTGFFLDHREMRAWTRELSAQRRVLNAFSYTGGFSVYALKGGALSVDSVDISKEALQTAEENLKLNGLEKAPHRFFCEDVFNFLRQESLPYDLVILDPPAFAKKQKDIIPACRGYKDINRLAMQKMPPSSLLLTCSCSHFVEESLFQKVLFQAALEAKRNVRLIGSHRLAVDHPINLFHPEGRYLKSFLLYVE